ncbi:hypothetical protein BaRGS_00016424, partial [Batillaria attramentaria]
DASFHECVDHDEGIALLIEVPISTTDCGIEREVRSGFLAVSGNRTLSNSCPRQTALLIAGGQ